MAVVIALAPTVSVCIPTYKGRATLGAAIESVLAQTFGDFELIVVDDRSPDDTEALVSAVADSRVRYVRNESNLGPEGNWNKCLGLARGEFFKLLPHDDILEPDCLKRQVDALRCSAEHGTVFAFSARTVIDARGTKLMVRRFGSRGAGPVDSDLLVAACVRMGTNVIGEPGGVLVRRSATDKVGCFDATNPYVIDLDYWLRLLRTGRAWYDDRPLCCFRLSATQWSVALARSQARDFLRLRKRLNLPAGLLDRLVGNVTPWLNQLGRILVFRLVIRP